MGDRTSGVLGTQAVPPGITGGAGAPPDVGFDLPGPVGLDAGSGAPAALQMTGWPRNLTWNDFSEVGSRPAGIDEDAQIHSEVTQPSRVSVQRQQGQYRVAALTVDISVDREDSWVVSAQKTADLLSHEQGHYDLTGLMGRDMGNEILAARAGTVQDLQDQVTRIIERYRQRAQALNDQYDRETDHSRNREAQRRWDERIRSAIQTGARFSAPPHS